MFFIVKGIFKIRLINNFFTYALTNAVNNKWWVIQDSNL
jgi:hypothetical protein